jgi:hypothetical protein
MLSVVTWGVPHVTGATAPCLARLPGVPRTTGALPACPPRHTRHLTLLTAGTAAEFSQTCCTAAASPGRATSEAVPPHVTFWQCCKRLQTQAPPPCHRQRSSPWQAPHQHRCHDDSTREQEIICAPRMTVPPGSRGCLSPRCFMIHACGFLPPRGGPLLHKSLEPRSCTWGVIIAVGLQWVCASSSTSCTSVLPVLVTPHLDTSCHTIFVTTVSPCCTYALSIIVVLCCRQSDLARFLCVLLCASVLPPCARSVF